MPLYEYECDACGHRFELIRKFSDPMPACVKCGGTVHRLVSSPAFQFKGSGWYATDYQKKSGPSEGSKADAKGRKDEKDSKDKKDSPESKDSPSESKPAASSEAAPATSPAPAKAKED